MRAGVAMAVLVAAACGPSVDVRPASCDFVALGACIVVHAGVSIDPPHVERQLAMALAYWDAPPGVLEGWAIVYFPDEFTCEGGRASGCTYFARDVRTIQVEALDPACAETAQLVHEVGHTVHDDGGHLSTFWNWEREQEATCHVVRDPGASPGCATTRYYGPPCD